MKSAEHRIETVACSQTASHPKLGKSSAEFDVTGFLRKTLAPMTVAANNELSANKDVLAEGTQTSFQKLPLTRDQDNYTAKKELINNCSHLNNPKPGSSSRTSSTPYSNRKAPKSSSKGKISRRLSADIYKTSARCAYCGANEAPSVGIYCKDCVALVRDTGEVQKRLLLESENESEAAFALTYRPSFTGSTDSSSQNQLPTVTESRPTMKPVTIGFTSPDLECVVASQSSSDVRQCQNAPNSVASSIVIASDVRPKPTNNSSSCASLHSTSTNGGRAVCRICQMPGEKTDRLISPCRCSGTMQHVHLSCLVHWLEISAKKLCFSPRCELCGYLFRTHSCCQCGPLHTPRCQHRDKLLHLTFCLMILIMIGCSVLSMLYLQGDKATLRVRMSMPGEEIVVICCSIVFFCAFFVAVYTQCRAQTSIVSLAFRCWLINKLWRIRNYSISEDNQPPYEVIIMQQQLGRNNYLRAQGRYFRSN